MQPRLLFVAGMTIGVMTPLVWAAYVARPAAHTALAPTVDVARAAPATHKPKPMPMPAAKIVTGSIGPAPAATSAPKTTVRVTLPPPKPTTKPRTATHVIAHAAASARAAPLRRTADARPHHVRRHVSERYAPAIVDHYNGAHIITVCAALTENEQLRAGCP